MEFAFDPGSARYRIKNLKDNHLTLFNQTEEETYSLPLVVMPEKLITSWGPNTFEDLKVENFEALLEFKPQVILLGTGKTILFLKPELLASLAPYRIGIEVMTTAAACRTYTILMSEGRNVAAILLP